jgi:hypothetical protein
MRKYHSLEITKQSHSEFFNFINSGGVIAKTASIQLPIFMLKGLEFIDTLLANSAPSIFALQRQIVLKKVNNFDWD